jgi:glycosyltransferase involved in cell wall biosynthesis
MPSYPETLGRSFLEAAASNCLVIGHKDTGVDGLLKHNKSAILVEKHTLTNELLKIFDEFSYKFLKKYTSNARKVVNELTWDKIGNKYDYLYQGTINN